MDSVYDLIIVGGDRQGCQQPFMPDVPSAGHCCWKRAATAEGLMIRMKSGIIRGRKRTAGST